LSQEGSVNRSSLTLLTLAGVLLALTLACNALASVPTGTPVPTLTASLTATETPAPTETPTITPTETPVPLSQQVSLQSAHFEESGQSPNYTISADTPVLEGSNDPRVQTFNALAEEITQDAVNEFEASLKYAPATPITSGSSLDVKYELLSPPGDPYSLKFNMAGYFDGAAHPYHYSKTLNYELEAGEELRLADLFLPDSNPLQVIADYCKAELSTRDIAFDAFSTGADPTEENYRNWNITRDGLLITFDEYQVAPYAAGPQTVLIPYSQLSAIIKPDGPLARFAP